MSERFGWQLALAALAALSAGCDGSPVEPALDGGHCDPTSRDLVWDVDGLPEPGAPLEWRERPALEPQDRKMVLVENHLPWDLNDRQAYYLRPGDAGFRARFPFVVGLGWPNAETLEFRLFIDAELATFEVDGESVDRAVVPLSAEGLGSLEVLIPFERFSPGMNHLHFIVTLDAGERDHPETPRVFTTGGFALTVAREAATPASEWNDTPGWREADAMPGAPPTLSYVNTDGETRYLIMRPERPRISGSRLDLTLHLQRDPNALICATPVDDTFAIVALLDGEQITLGGHRQIIATLAPGEAREFQFSIDLPDTEGAHRLEVHALPGLGRPARLAGRRRMPPWPVLVRTITDFTWQEGPAVAP